MMIVKETPQSVVIKKRSLFIMLDSKCTKNQQKISVIDVTIKAEDYYYGKVILYVYKLIFGEHDIFNVFNNKLYNSYQCVMLIFPQFKKV